MIGPRSALLTIARFTLLEARHGKLVWICLLACLLLGATSYFVHAMSLIEADVSAISIVAPLARLTGVAIVGVFVIAGTCRILEERGLDGILSAPVSRNQWLTGRWLGLAGAAIFVACFVALPLFAYAPFDAAAQWTVSLAAELMLVVALGLMLSVSLARMPAALLGLAAFYLCARTIGVISLLHSSGLPALALASADGSTNSVPGYATLSDIGGLLINGLSLILPRLDLMSQTNWLLSDARAGLGWSASGSLTPGLLQAIRRMSLIHCFHWAKKMGLVMVRLN